MPHIVYGNTYNRGRAIDGNLQSADFKYSYPNNLNLKPGTPLHDSIVAKIMERANESYDIMKVRHESWKKIDRTLTAFIDLSEEEKKVKASDERKPVSIVIPTSYATLQTLLTYWVSALLNGEAIFHFEGTGPEDSLGAALLEKVIQVHATKKKMVLALHTQFRDALAYGIGVVHVRWEKEVAFKQVPKALGVLERISGMFKPQSFERQSVETVRYEGNVIDNIDPYLYLPDPNIPAHRVQDGEYVGWVERTNMIRLFNDEAIGEGTVFNVKYVQLAKGRMTSRIYEELDTKRDRIRSESKTTTVTLPVDRIYMYATIIPKEWEIGESTKPAKYLFEVVGDSILTRMQPLNLDHNLYPIAVCAPEYDGYSVAPVSVMELIYGLQEYTDWLASSHVANVRKVINNTLIVDPFLVNMDDVRNPKAGNIWRLRRNAWGRGSLEGVAKQFPVTDVTSQHLGDISFIDGVIQSVTGATDVLKGSVRRTSERITAQEIRDNRLAAISRVEKSVRLGGIQSLSDIALLCASHTQQFMTNDLFVKTIGTWDETLREEYGIADDRIRVRPIDIMVDFDVVPIDPSTAGGEFVDAWTQVFQAVSQSEILSQRLDVVRIFKHLARIMGAKNLGQFELKEPTMPMMPEEGQAAIVPDELVNQRIASGRYIAAPQIQMMGDMM